MADLLGTTEQTLRLWEKHRRKVMNGSADRLLRILYSEFIDRDGSAREMAARLADVEGDAETEVRMRETDHGWEVDSAQAA